MLDVSGEQREAQEELWFTMFVVEHAADIEEFWMTVCRRDVLYVNRRRRVVASANSSQEFTAMKRHLYAFALGSR